MNTPAATAPETSPLVFLGVSVLLVLALAIGAAFVPPPADLRRGDTPAAARPADIVSPGASKAL